MSKRATHHNAIRPDVAELFPRIDCAYTDAEVAKIIYRGATRAFQQWLDKQPVSVCFRGPRGQRLLTRLNISRVMDRMELCERPNTDPANSNSKRGKTAPIGTSRARSTGGDITKARAALIASSQRNTG